MTETEYFSDLQDLLDSRICKAPTAVGGHYVISEPAQSHFELNTRRLSSHKAIHLEKMRPLEWPCFKNPHKYAHKRCDCIVVSWDKNVNGPVFVLVELKGTNPGDARKQLGASLAFCQFAHSMVGVGHTNFPKAHFAAVTVMNLPFALKALSTPALPAWNTPKLAPDCPHMRFNRSQGSLPIAALMAAI